MRKKLAAFFAAIAMKSSVRIFFLRLPKNILSNRWWIVWNKSIFFATESPRLAGGAQSSEGATGISLAEGWQSYVIWYATLFPSRSFHSCFHGVFVPELGRFGNMTRRLVAGLLIADVLNLGHVIVPRSAEFQAGIYPRGVHTPSEKLRFWLWSTQRPTLPGPTRKVRVLHKRDLLIGPHLEAVLVRQQATKAWADLFSLLVNKPELPKLPNSHLVIHLRGGDVFGPRKPASYGQPPLAFYERILDHERWSAVTVVHEDSKNPLLKPLLESCTARKIPVTTQSEKARDDIAVLLLASTLAAGRGTFMPAVVGLSRNVERVFYFHDKFPLHPPVAGVETIRISDKEGTYVRDVLSNNWKNSEYQRDLMLTYPQGNLEFSTLD